MMKLIEHFNALFPYGDYSFPEGVFEIPFENKKYTVQCVRVVLLKKQIFDLNPELRKIYSKLSSNKNYFTERYPYMDDHGILIQEKFYQKLVKDLCAPDEDQIKTLLLVCDTFFCLCLEEEHEYNGQSGKELDFINEIRDVNKIEKRKETFFLVIDQFHKYVTIQRTPFINVTDINFWNIDGMYSYFCKEDMQIITKERHIKHPFWEPVTHEFGEKTKAFFKEHNCIPLDDYLIAQSKVYIRSRNYAMAIVYATIALDIIVPQFLREYLKYKGVDSNSLNDFENKFGLSVRVKAILKLILPPKYDVVLTNVGTLIKNRNDVIHYGKTSEAFRNENIDKLLKSAEILIKELKKRQTGIKKEK